MLHKEIDPKKVIQEMKDKQAADKKLQDIKDSLPDIKHLNTYRSRIVTIMLNDETLLTGEVIMSGNPNTFFRLSKDNTNHRIKTDTIIDVSFN